jgi:hypothetical protein
MGATVTGQTWVALAELRGVGAAAVVKSAERLPVYAQPALFLIAAVVFVSVAVVPCVQSLAVVP